MTVSNFSRFSFWNFGLLLALLLGSAFLWLDSHLGYQAQSTLLLQSKSDTYEEKQLVATVTGFAKTGQFVKRTLSSERLQAANFSELSDQEQITFLVKQVTLTGGTEGGLVRVQVLDTDKERAVLVSEESIETLLRMGNFYYGTDKKIDIRVIDKPEAKRALLHPVLYGFKTGVSALFVFFGIQLLSSLFLFGGQKIKTFRFSKKIKPGSAAEEAAGSKEMFVPQKVDPKFLYGEAAESAVVLEDLPQPRASDLVNREVYGMREGTGLASVSVAMEDLPFTFEAPETTPKEEAIIDPEEHPLEAYIAEQKQQEEFGVTAEAEPSVLEYKKRLNELLAQK